MSTTALQRLARSVAVAAATLLAACAEQAPVAPQRAHAPHVGVSSSAIRGAAMANSADAGRLRRATGLGVCADLAPPAGSKLAAHVYAHGVQIYRWNGQGWTFAGPSAVLTADAGGNGVVGTHSAGPVWESLGGGKVYGALLRSCTPDANAIPWLLLGASADGGPGPFRRTTHIQRVSTTGGKAPATPGSFAGQEARVPYAAEYLFFRSE